MKTVVSIVASALAFGFASAAGAADIKIGVTLPLTGYAASYGEDAKRGADLAVEQANAAGGIKGDKIQLIVEDDAGAGKTGISSTQKLVSVDKVIEREEQHIQRLQIDAFSERKQSLVTDMVAKQEKVTELQQGKVIPLNCLFAVRLWHRNADQLAARCASVKNAFISMGGAVVHHATIPENARQLFFQTWPGWTFGTYRAFDLGRRRLLPRGHDSLVRRLYRATGRC